MSNEPLTDAELSCLRKIVESMHPEWLVAENMERYKKNPVEARRVIARVKSTRK